MRARRGPSLGWREAARLAAPWFLASSLTSCATSHHVESTSAGLTVHTFRRAYTNAHVVSDGTSSFMVDAGLEGEAPLLAEDLRNEGFAPASLSAIVLTHGHADHAGGAGYFKRQFGTRIVAGLGEQDMLRSGHNDTLCPTNGEAEGRRAADQAATYRPVEADELVAGSLDLGPITGIAARAVALPGHTRGSLVVVLPSAVLVGDLFRGAVLGSTAETHFYMCDLADNRRDVTELVEVIAPTARVFFTGHFGPVSREAVMDSDLFGPLTRTSR